MYDWEKFFLPILFYIAALSTGLGLELVRYESPGERSEEHSCSENRPGT